MEGEVVRDDQWERLKPFVLGGRKGRRGPRSDGRRFFDAILWLARSGARWRDLPEDRFGPYQTVKRRYYRWIDQGVFDRIFEAVAADPDMEWLSIDATVIRAQAQAAGGRRKRGTASPGSRQLPWRIWQQNPCCSGCPRAAGSFPSRPRTAEPHGSGLRPRSGTASQTGARIAYKQRWGIESFFAKLKQWRRLATRHDKLAANFLGFIKLASIMLWLK